MSTSEKSESESPKSNKGSRIKVLNLIKDGWDKLSIELDSIVKTTRKFNDTLDNDHKNNFKQILSSLETFKDDFKNVFFNISLSVGNASSNTSSTNNSEININLSVKNSYNNIYNEFLKLESLTKNMILNQSKLKTKKINRIQTLEKQLQGYLEEINDFDFKKIDKNFSKIYNNNTNNKEKIKTTNDQIDKLFQKNQNIEKYEPMNYNFENRKDGDFGYEVDLEEEIEDNKNERKNIFLSNSETEEKEVKFLNEIINMDALDQKDAVKYIKSLIKEKEKNEKNSK